MTRRIHIANATSEDIYVMAAESPEWQFFDFLGDTALFLEGLYEIRAAHMMVEIPEMEEEVPDVLCTFNDLRRYILLIKGLWGASSRFIDLNFDAMDAIKKNSTKIPAYSSINIYEAGIFETYLSVSGVASLRNAETITLNIISEEKPTIYHKTLMHIPRGKTTSNSRNLPRKVKQASFSTNNDSSWIVKDNEVIRAKYGTLWQEDRNSGFYRLSMGNRLLAGQRLSPGECISSFNGDYDFVYQSDGNAVVYNRQTPNSERAVSASMTNGQSLGFVTLENDGNLVIYDATNRPIAASNSHTDLMGSHLIMQDDDNLVVYTKTGRPIWASRTCKWQK